MHTCVYVHLCVFVLETWRIGLSEMLLRRPDFLLSDSQPIRLGFQCKSLRIWGCEALKSYCEDLAVLEFTDTTPVVAGDIRATPEVIRCLQNLSSVIT